MRACFNAHYSFLLSLPTSRSLVPGQNYLLCSLFELSLILCSYLLLGEGSPSPLAKLPLNEGLALTTLSLRLLYLPLFSVHRTIIHSVHAVTFRLFCSVVQNVRPPALMVFYMSVFCFNLSNVWLGLSYYILSFLWLLLNFQPPPYTSCIIY